ncbi:hypothetical protein KIH87_08990 [Paraneptunicella aestuarii]|uniref:hypothetical protein n=1 Tax=Paraneptunicella aestuarii TaxID=2831148 RepID=UPI001E4CBB26|nr:hypothetical protein [Paraneptunicella aestuarii]UAA40450.1 hypothetical protein KIH87_08990 [Paraneptunicella aestuarii]
MKYINKNVLSAVVLTASLSLPVHASESDITLSVENLLNQLINSASKEFVASSGGTKGDPINGGGGSTTSSGGTKGDPLE